MKRDADSRDEGRSPPARLAGALTPLGRRVAARHWLECGRLFLLWSLAWACMVLLAARSFPWAGAPTWAALGVPVSLRVFAFAGWRRRPDLWTAATAADGLGLKERAITALELLEAGDSVPPRPLAPLVAADALDHLRALDCRRYPVVSNRRGWIHTGILGLLLLTLAYLPSPAGAELARRAAEQEAIRRAGALVEDLIRRIESDELLDHDPRGEQVRKALAELAREMAGAGNRQEAASALAAARDRLARLLARDELATRGGLNLLRDAWAGSRFLSPLGQAVAAGNPQELAQLLEGLVARLDTMDPVSRGELAGEFQAAANVTRGDAALTEALRRAAVAAGTGDGRAQPAFTALGESLSRAMTAAGASASIRELMAALGRQAGTLSTGAGPSLASGSTTAAPGIPAGAGPPGAAAGADSPGAGASSGAGAAGGSDAGSGSGTAGGAAGGSSPGASSGAGSGSSGGGAGLGTGTGSGSGSGRGSTGSGSGAGTGSGAGLGSTNRSGTSPAPGTGSRAGMGDPGKGLGYYDAVYDPELLGGEGPRSAVTGQAATGEGPEVTTPFSPVISGALRPYAEVYGRYAARAMENLARQDLSPEVRELVRRYFAELAPSDR